ncbi:MAG: hypothetical protein V4534_07990 [Myxococcota bacterium]
MPFTLFFNGTYNPNVFSPVMWAGHSLDADIGKPIGLKKLSYGIAILQHSNVGKQKIKKTLLGECM